MLRGNWINAKLLGLLPVMYPGTSGNYHKAKSIFNRILHAGEDNLIEQRVRYLASTRAVPITSDNSLCHLRRTLDKVPSIEILNTSF